MPKNFFIYFCNENLFFCCRERFWQNSLSWSSNSNPSEDLSEQSQQYSGEKILRNSLKFLLDISLIYGSTKLKYFLSVSIFYLVPWKRSPFQIFAEESPVARESLWIARCNFIQRYKGCKNLATVNWFINSAYYPRTELSKSTYTMPYLSLSSTPDFSSDEDKLRRLKTSKIGFWIRALF